MKTTVKTFQALVHDFFECHLAVERNASSNTIAAYRDALKLFILFASQDRGCPPERLEPDVLDVVTIRGFLRWLEHVRGCSPSTRNHRLAALKSFVRFVASVEPQYLERCRVVREIQPARVEHAEPAYLGDTEVLQLIEAVNGSTSERRDRALLLTLYNTGARVQEVIDLNLADIHDGDLPFVRLRGKGRKQRTCPLWPRTMEAIRAWLDQRRAPQPEDPVFLNRRGKRLGRSGVAYILKRTAIRAGIEPRYAKQVTPHVLRHTTAMHLLQSGVDIVTIAAWLGHASLQTTHAYMEIDLRMKQQALANLAAPAELHRGQHPADELIEWLESIGRGNNYAQPKPPVVNVSGRMPPQLHITGNST